MNVPPLSSSVYSGCSSCDVANHAYLTSFCTHRSYGGDDAGFNPYCIRVKYYLLSIESGNVDVIGTANTSSSATRVCTSAGWSMICAERRDIVCEIDLHEWKISSG